MTFRFSQELIEKAVRRLALSPSLVSVKFPRGPDVFNCSSAETYRVAAYFKCSEVGGFAGVIVVEIWESHAGVDYGVGDRYYRIG